MVTGGFAVAVTEYSPDNALMITPLVAEIIARKA
jgi:hypothetical protein